MRSKCSWTGATVITAKLNCKSLHSSYVLLNHYSHQTTGRMDAEQVLKFGKHRPRAGEAIANVRLCSHGSSLVTGWQIRMSPEKKEDLLCQSSRRKNSIQLYEDLWSLTLPLRLLLSTAPLWYYDTIQSTQRVGHDTDPNQFMRKSKEPCFLCCENDTMKSSDFGLKDWCCW